MKPLLFLFAVLFAAGLFFILSDLLRLPMLRTAKAMLGAGRKHKISAGTIEAWLMSGAVKVSKYIRIDEYKRSRMANVLKAAGFTMTSEVYSAYAITKSGAILLGVIPCLVLVPLLSSLLITYDNDIKDVIEALDKANSVDPPIPPKATGDVEARIIALACSQPPKGRTRWTLRLLEEKVVELQIYSSAAI